MVQNYKDHTHQATLKWYCDQIFVCVSHRIPCKNKNPVYRLQISALVLEIFKFEKWGKYANEMTDDIIHSAQYYIEYINRAILANLQCRSLKLGSRSFDEFMLLFVWYQGNLGDS